MKDDPMHLSQNSHGVWYYRRPVTLEDQRFWFGKSGQPKKEWSRSLRTKDKSTAKSLMHEAARLYEEERAKQFERNAALAGLATEQETRRAREEREAHEAFLAAQEKRQDEPERREVRLLYRQFRKLSTQQLPPDRAAAIDVMKELDADLSQANETIAYLEARIRDMGGVPITSASPDIAHQSGGPSLESILLAYEADKSPAWSASTRKALVPVFRLLRDVYPGRAAGSITRQEARELVAMLQKVPTQIGKRKELRGLAVPEAVEKNAALGFPTLRPKTINDGYLLHIASIWNWAARELLVTGNPFTGLTVPDPVADRDRRDPFSPAQLSALFSSTPWNLPWAKDRDRPGAYWVPLICLFNGLRNGEACGLRVEDVYEVEGQSVLHVREYEGRTIKTPEARAELPIHPELLRLGFMDFVADQRKAGAVGLFPDGKPSNRGQHGAKLGERFSAHVRALGLEGTKLGMHSFRHNFEDALRAAEIAPRTALALARRKEPGSGDGYGDGLSMRQKSKALAKIQYASLDLSHLSIRNADR
ncbi:site-specific integrase [Qipengyuania qiaonensis]|uniref:Site-specific integrase n=1 Tax=Qipengyuania qiaonensis TaxID=2867240 RepID=A0ABS7J7R7_9SPHN|nr:site-specific integrase [Qipengyuania qiaonensis]MBX7482973.1 site-specific integrase [Qipengyuania qiaonensis]